MFKNLFLSVILAATLFCCDDLNTSPTFCDLLTTTSVVGVRRTATSHSNRLHAKNKKAGKSP